MIPRDALDAYLRFDGDTDKAQIARVDTKYWSEIDSLLTRLHIVDGGWAAESFRADLMQDIEEAGITVDILRELKKQIDIADTDRKKIYLKLRNGIG